MPKVNFDETIFTGISKYAFPCEKLLTKSSTKLLFSVMAMKVRERYENPFGTPKVRIHRVSFVTVLPVHRLTSIFASGPDMKLFRPAVFEYIER